jgi:uncharacterized membrane protein
MMDFKNLQESWRNQSIKPIKDLDQLTSVIEDKWKKNQKMLLKRNLFLSVAFAGVLMVVSIIFLKFRNQYEWPFTVSIVTMYCILLVFLVASWKSYAFKREMFETSSYDYVIYKLSKLAWQRKVLTSFTTIYGLLLWLTLLMYTWEVTGRGTWFFRASAITITSVYCLGMMAWGKYKYKKKQLPLLDALITDLQELKQSLEH